MAFIFLSKQKKVEVFAELQKEVTNHLLDVTGEIPDWLCEFIKKWPN